jgi:predicted dehydrogenase
VLCEKPLAATLEEGLSMLAAERQSRIPVAIGYQWSYCAAIQALKKDIQSGLLGAPRRLKTLVLWPRGHSYYQRNDWAGRLRMPDGAWVLDSPVNNATAHYLHNMFYLLGEQRQTSAQPRQLQAELYRANQIENFDAAALRVWSDVGVEILFYTAHPVRELLDPWMEFEFELATVTYRGGVQPEFIAHYKDGTEVNYGSPGENNVDKLWQMAAALRGGPLPACGIPAALSHTRVVEALRSVPVRSFSTDLVHLEEIESDRLVWVEGLGEAFQEAFSRGVLPAELGTAAWAERSELLTLPVLDVKSG